MEQAEEIDKAITAVLPDLPAEVLNTVVDTLKTLGTETVDDLQYITEQDLVPVLKPVQARRLVAAWRPNKSSAYNPTTSSPLYPCSSPPSLPQSPASSSSSCISSPATARFHLNWLESFKIPWGNLPEELIQQLEREKRPDPRLRRAMVRIVVKEMMTACDCPSFRDSVEIAKQMVSKYPNSLQDVIDGDIIGTGHDSLAKQLQARVDNAKRPETQKITKRKSPSEEEPLEDPTIKRACVQDTYGCINWAPKYLALSETVESQQEKKETMKNMSKEPNSNKEDVQSLMQSTFFTQRQNINQGMSIEQLEKEWPFLFKDVGMEIHYQELVGKPLLDSFFTNVEKKGKRLLNFLRKVAAPKHAKVLDRILKFQSDRGRDGCSEDIIQMVLLLMAYFKEEEGVLFHLVEDTCLAPEVQLERVPVTPCIIVCGASCLAAPNFMLSIDRVVVNEKIASFTSALCLMFGSYYCFNVHYPVELRSTLEFLQRCFFSINQEKGTKVQWNGKKKVPSVNPRVLTLIADLANHEWI